MNRTAFSIGVALVFGLSAFALAIPRAEAAPLPLVKMDCHGPAGFTADASWVWTQGGNVIAGPYTQSCTDSGATGGFPHRPAAATGFEFTVVLKDSTGLVKTPPTVLESVDPAHGFHYSDSFNMGDPEAVHVHVKA